METRSQNIESLLTEGVFDIPDYQRSYSWQQQQLDELFNDIRYLPDDRTHFFGNIILAKQDVSYETASGRKLDKFYIVDGQQRLTTTLIFLDAAREIDESVSTLIDESNAITVPNDRPRLLPQDTDREFFADGILGETQLTPETPSQNRLRSARDYTEKRMREMDGEPPVLELAQTLLYHFEINVVEVDDDSEAASIFESINDRGKPLSSLEKSKSFLMYMDDRSAVKQELRTTINDRFGGIYRNLFVLEDGHDRVDNFNEDTFQQFHWGFYDGYDSNEYFNPLDTLKNRLYEGYRQGDHQYVTSTIDDYTESLREASIAFEKIFRPETWDSDRVSKCLIRLFALRRVANVLPILMVSTLQYEDDHERLEKILKKCETLVFRVYAIDGRRSNTGRSKLVNLAHTMYSNPNHGYNDTIRRLEKITRDYADDNRFERNLRDPTFYKSVSSQDIRYLFFYYEQHLDADVDEILEKDLEQILSTDFSVEHILAQSLSEEHIPDRIIDEYDEHVHRLGNLTTAKKEWNSRYGNLPFEKKRTDENNERGQAYENSGLTVQRVLKNIKKFDRQAIDTREEEIVQFALNEWSVTSKDLDETDIQTVRDRVDAIRDGKSAGTDGLPLTETELFTLAAVADSPGYTLRVIHKTAAGYDGSPVSWAKEWGSERKTVQRALWSLRRMGLASLNNRSWHPNDQLIKKNGFTLHQ